MEPTFWDQYRWQILGVITLIFLQALLIVALLLNLARRRRAASKIKRLALMVDERKHAEEVLGKLTERLLAAQDEERRRIARELHDASAKQRRFPEEARITALLGHTNVITIPEIDIDIKGSLIISEYIMGQTLAELLESRRMGITEVVEVAIQIGSALSAAHNHQIIHRDIKPSNIMIGADGSVKVIDFGLAKVNPGKSQYEEERITNPDTSKSVVFGTPYYMSPEQATGSSNIDVRSDIWSLGAVMYEMLAGQPPFHGLTVPDMVAAIMTYNPFPIPHHPEGIPKSLERIVEKSLEKDLDRRYQSVSDVLFDLQALKREIKGITEGEIDFNVKERTAQAASKEFEEIFFQFRQIIDSEAIAQKYLLSRYHLLINRKHVSGLSTGEKEELASLTQALDEMDEPFYKRIINTLQSLDRSKKA